jgi:DegV family protein with EDD domain
LIIKIIRAAGIGGLEKTMIRIITDSTCDITFEEAKTLGIDIVPLTIHFGEEEYRDGIDITKEEFYEKLKKTDVLPTTSQASPLAFEEIFEKYTENGDEIVGIFISSELSGTLQSAMIAASNIDGDNIYLVDSRNVSLGTSVLIREAVRMRENGLSAEQIAKRCEYLAGRVRVVAAVESLKYLKMGGRLSNTSAFVGTLLHINPVISIVDGKVEVIGKCRGFKSATNMVLNYVKENAADKFHTFVYGHADSKAALEKFVERCEGETEGMLTATAEIGAVVGTHLGPGAVGVAYIIREEIGTNQEREEYCA